MANPRWQTISGVAADDPAVELTNSVARSGDTMTGPLILSGNAIDDLQAVPLQQLENKIANIQVRDDNLYTPASVDGKTSYVSLVHILKGEIDFEAQYTPVMGEGISAPDRAMNRLRLYYAGIESTNQRRPIKMPKNGKFVSDNVPFATDNVEINLNGCEIIHESTTPETLIAANGISGAAPIVGFKIYNGIINVKGHLKASVAYNFGSQYARGSRIHDIIFRDPFSTACLVSDPYSLSAPYPDYTSSDLELHNIKVERTPANLAAIASKPAMMGGDQIVVTGYDSARVWNIKPYHSGRSGISYGLCRGGFLRDVDATDCAIPVYIETLEDFIVEDIIQRNHMHWDGVNTTDFWSAAVWCADGDWSAIRGFGGARRGIIRNVIATDISRTNGAGNNKGYSVVRLSGRNGVGASDVAIEGITGYNIAQTGGSDPGASILMLEGNLTNVIARSVNGRGVPILVRMDKSYTTSGGVATNIMTDTWVENSHASSCGYAVYGSEGGGTHVRSGVRNSTFGGGAFTLNSTLNDELNRD